MPAPITNGEAGSSVRSKINQSFTEIASKCQVVASRTDMASLSSSTPLVFLTEAGREGLFKWSVLNHSASVTADPYQGLYIPPASVPSGASGAWVRQVPDRRYELTWWGVTEGYGNTGNLPLQSALDLLPDGCTFVFPPYEVVCSAGVYSSANNVAFVGHGFDKSLLRCETSPTTESYWSTTSLLYVQADGCSADGIAFQHRYHQAQSGGGFCLQFDSRDGVAHKGFRIKGARFQNCSEGFIAFADCYLTNALVPVSGVQIDYAEFDQIDYQAISLFGASDINIDFVRIRMKEWTVARFTPPIRIIGATNVHLNDFDIVGPGTNTLSGGNRSYGIAVVTMGQNTANASLINRRCKNVYIRAGKISRVIQAIVCQPVEGDLVVSDVDIYNDISITTITTAFLISADSFAGVPQKFDRISIKNVNARGITRFVDANGVLIDEIEVDGCKWVGNSRSPVLGEAAFFKFNTSGDQVRAPLLTRITGNTGHANGAAIFSDIELTGMLGNCVVEAYNNRMPFGGTGAVVSVGGTGGRVYTTAIDAGQAVGGVLTQGGNTRWGVDIWPMISTGDPGTSGGGGGGDGGGTERVVNGTFDSSANWTLSATASISGGALNAGTTQWAANYQDLGGSYVDGEVYDVVVVVSSIGNGSTRIDVGPTWASSSLISTLLTTGTNNLSFTVTSGSAGTNNIRLSFVVYGAGATEGAVIDSVSVQKAA